MVAYLISWKHMTNKLINNIICKSYCMQYHVKHRMINQLHIVTLLFNYFFFADLKGSYIIDGHSLCKVHKEEYCKIHSGWWHDFKTECLQSRSLCNRMKQLYLTRNARWQSRRPRYKAAVHVPDFDSLVPATELSLPIQLRRLISKGIIFCIRGRTTL